jgi:hypothetical protein
VSGSVTGGVYGSQAGRPDFIAVCKFAIDRGRPEALRTNRVEGRQQYPSDADRSDRRLDAAPNYRRVAGVDVDVSTRRFGGCGKAACMVEVVMGDDDVSNVLRTPARFTDRPEELGEPLRKVGVDQNELVDREKERADSWAAYLEDARNDLPRHQGDALSVLRN